MKGSKKFLKKKIHYNTAVILILLLGEFLVLKIFVPQYLSLGNIVSIGRQSSITGIIAIAMGFVLISGGIDFSLGSQIVLSSMLVAIFMVRMHFPVAPALILGLVISTFLGFVNGIICAKIRIHPFILTMATGVIYRGAAKIMNRGMPLYGLPEKFLTLDQIHLLGLPESLLMLLLCLLTGHYVLRKTYLGKYIYAIGIDERTAEFAGINTKQIKWSVYGIAGFFCGIAGILLLARVGSAQPSALSGIELDVLVAAAIGGVGFKGGRGYLINIVLGVLIMEFFGDALIIFGVGEYFRNIFKGFVLLLALYLDDVVGS